MSDLPTHKGANLEDMRSRGLKTMHDPLSPATDLDVAKTLHRKMQNETLSEADHNWLARYHAKSAEDMRPKETTPYDGLEDE